MAEKKKFNYGGQAVIEGVMMRGPKKFAVAVRRANKEIVTTTEDVDSTLGRFKWLDKPFLRGTLALIDSMALGIKALKYSADIAMADAEEEAAAANAPGDNPGDEAAVSKPEAGADQQEPQQTSADQKPKKNSTINDLTIGITMVLGIALGVGLFLLVPILIVRPLTESWASWQRAALEGGIKLALFLGYVLLISLMKDIQRVFQYHGAEHKTINAYEAKVELTVQNVIEYGKAHVRCGTTFLLVVLLTSIFVFMFVSWDSIIQRFLYKIVLLPVIAGIAYEVIRFAGNCKESVITKILVFPGMLVQKITTREPEPEMIEVAIRSLQCVLEQEESPKDEMSSAAAK